MKKRLRRLAAIGCVSWAGLVAAVAAGDSEAAWRSILALDAGPAEQPRNPETASAIVRAHVARQEQALRGFLDAYPGDSRNFEARLRLARLLEIRADLEGSEKPRMESQKLLAALEKTATPEQRPELDFANIARLLRGLRAPNATLREETLRAARAFQRAHPADRRLASLLAEVATLFDAEPKTKEALLEDAGKLATDDELQGRIADDLKRVRLVGREIPLRFTSFQGEEIRSPDPAGRPAFVVFFASASPPAVVALGRLHKEIATLPPASVRVLGISLDEKRDALATLLKTRGLAWPTAWDGRSWESPLVRELGINTVPTVWLLDGRGRLRSLNALEGAAQQARQLLSER